ncbi:hypothetical protein WR25_05699 isoform B [Diploscapter pachys]|uniref:BTB domain-containing protein n=1 Tax=Diploscapter pachys TaxID=2018661 RepID=A0A2A2LIJ5_9BILA|nr:hypothetical protein WR25_05699 isoform B [Diploscapter pachys]
MADNHLGFVMVGDGAHLERQDSNSSLSNAIPASMAMSGPSTSRRTQPHIRNNDCITTVNPILLTQRWTVVNFAHLIKLSPPGQCLRSTVFKDTDFPEACWQLCLYPGGKREENTNHVSLFLKMSSTSPHKEVLVKAEYKFFFLDDNDQPKFSNVNIGDFHAKPPKGGHSWGLRNIPKAKVQNCIRSDNSLVISCSIELMPDSSKWTCKKMPRPNQILNDSVSIPRVHVDAEMTMFKSGEGADMRIQVIGVNDTLKIFNVHKYKLMAHSEVFRAMLSHGDMITEAREGLLTISDFSENIVQIMLEFIYAGAVQSNITLEIASEVIQIADKYDLPALKELCEQQLINKMTVDNVLECAELADSHNAEHLLENCLITCAQNRQRVIGMQGWVQLKERNPKLTNKILEQVLFQEKIYFSKILIIDLLLK